MPSRKQTLHPINNRRQWHGLDSISNRIAQSPRVDHRNPFQLQIMRKQLWTVLNFIDHDHPLERLQHGFGVFQLNQAVRIFEIEIIR